MTAEIAILNRSAVALAADSAITIGRDRVWKNANKLFSLSTNNDIGIMIFGTGDYCGIAWEIVIKQYRKHIGKRRFLTMAECTEEFKSFLDAFDPGEKDIAELNIYYIFLLSIDSCKKAISAKKMLQRRKQFVAKIDDLIADVDQFPILLPNLSLTTFSTEHKDIVKRFLENDAGLHVTNEMCAKMVALCFERVRRQFKSSFDTGVVFAGYGEDELLPVIEHWTVDGKYDGQTRAWVEREHNLNGNTQTSSLVIPFAQSDIAYLFMEGMQLDYLEFIELTTAGILKEKSNRLIDAYVPSSSKSVERNKQSKDDEVLVKKLMDEFKDMRKDQAIAPMLRVVSSLPKEELAAMAEALVEITSLRRKIDSRLESVGGPVDVAIISKSDGFIWIKRKHYFSMDLNHDFMVRRATRFEGSVE